MPPTLAEQERIANALSDVDSLIEGLQRLIDKKKLMKQGAMQALLTGRKRLPGFDKGQGYKQTEVGAIPEDWDVLKIGEFCRCYSGGTPLTSRPEYYDGSIPWITSSDLNKQKIYDVRGRITKAGLENSSAKLVNQGTLLLALYGATAGVSAITQIDAAINQAILAIFPQESSSQFLYQYLQLKKDFYIYTYTQGGQPNFSGEIVKSFMISLPPIVKEQEAIATTLSDMDAEIEALEQKLAKYRQIKQGMMQELLTGKTRLVEPSQGA